MSVAVVDSKQANDTLSLTYKLHVGSGLARLLKEIERLPQLHDQDPLEIQRKLKPLIRSFGKVIRELKARSDKRSRVDANLLSQTISILDNAHRDFKNASSLASKLDQGLDENQAQWHRFSIESMLKTTQDNVSAISAMSATKTDRFKQMTKVCAAVVCISAAAILPGSQKENSNLLYQTSLPKNKKAEFEFSDKKLTTDILSVGDLENQLDPSFVILKDKKLQGKLWVSELSWRTADGEFHFLEKRLQSAARGGEKAIVETEDGLRPKTDPPIGYRYANDTSPYIVKVCSESLPDTAHSNPSVLIDSEMSAVIAQLRNASIEDIPHTLDNAFLSFQYVTSDHLQAIFESMESAGISPEEIYLNTRAGDCDALSLVAAALSNEAGHPAGVIGGYLIKLDAFDPVGHGRMIYDPNDPKEYDPTWSVGAIYKDVIFQAEDLSTLEAQAKKIAEANSTAERAEHYADFRNTLSLALSRSDYNHSSSDPVSIAGAYPGSGSSNFSNYFGTSSSYKQLFGGLGVAVIGIGIVYGIQRLKRRRSKRFDFFFNKFNQKRSGDVFNRVFDKFLYQRSAYAAGSAQSITGEATKYLPRFSGYSEGLRLAQINFLRVLSLAGRLVFTAKRRKQIDRLLSTSLSLEHVMLNLGPTIFSKKKIEAARIKYMDEIASSQLASNASELKRKETELKGNPVFRRFAQLNRTSASQARRRGFAETTYNFDGFVDYQFGAGGKIHWSASEKVGRLQATKYLQEDPSSGNFRICINVGTNSLDGTELLMELIKSKRVNIDVSEINLTAHGCIIETIENDALRDVLSSGKDSTKRLLEKIADHQSRHVMWIRKLDMFLASGGRVATKLRNAWTSHLPPAKVFDGKGPTITIGYDFKFPGSNEIFKQLDQESIIAFYQKD